MRIDGTNPLLEPQGTTMGQTTASGGAKAEEAGGAQNSDAVSLSVSSTVRDLASQLQNLPDIRQERVAALKQAVETGKYQVSNEQLASALQTQLLRTDSSNE